MKSKLTAKLRNFMYGRNGIDQLTVLILLISLLMSIIARTFNLPLLKSIYYIGLVLSLYRILSKDLVQRRKEERIFAQKQAKLNSWFKVQKRIFQERKTHRHFKCPNCRQRLRVPKGRGKIAITCAKCGEKFSRKS